MERKIGKQIDAGAMSAIFIYGGLKMKRKMYVLGIAFCTMPLSISMFRIASRYLNEKNRQMILQS